MDGSWWRVTKTWSTGEGDFRKWLQHSCLENPMNSMKRKKRFDTGRWDPQVGRCPICHWKRAGKYYQKKWRGWAKWKSSRCVDVSGGASKVQCCKEQYYIETCKVKSMNQGKLEVVKQEMARVNIDILRISELKWTGMGEFNSDDHNIYYCE